MSGASKRARREPGSAGGAGPPLLGRLEGRAGAFLAALSASPRNLAIFCAALIGLAGIVFARTAWMSDDAYITLRTLDNFVHGHGLRWNVAERVQSFTHPLWLFVMLIPYAITREAFHTVTILSLLISTLTVALLVWRYRKRPGAVLAGMAALLFSRAFTDYSTSGLENPLTHLLLALFVIRFPEDRPSGKDLLVLAGIAGLAALNRLDTILLFGPGVAIAWARHGFGRGIRLVVAGFLPLLLWSAFAALYYGSPFPNTALAKLSTGIGQAALIRHGFYYLANSLREDPLTLAWIILALAAIALRRTAVAISIGAGVLLYLIYILRIGGDFMSGRFLAAPLLASVVLLVRADFFNIRVAKPAAVLAALFLGLLSPHPPVLSGSGFGIDQSGLLDARGISDERRYYFWSSGWLNGSGGGKPRATQYIETGRKARQMSTPIIVEGAIGYVGYYAGPKVHLLDYHGLADPLLARLPIVERDPLYDDFMQLYAGRTDPEGWRIGHFLRRVPRGYIRTLLTGKNAIEDPKLARLHDRLALITRAPLLAPGRLGAIVALNLGRYDRLIDAGIHPPFETPDWSEAIAVHPDEPYFLTMRAQSLLAAGDADGALEHLARAARGAPDYGLPLCMMGDILFDQKRAPEGAVAHWTDAVARDPKDVRPQMRLSDWYLASRQFERAIDVSQRALEIDPRLEWAHLNIARAYAEMGQLELAIDWIKRAIRVNSRSVDALDLLGLARLSRGEPGEAAKIFEKAIRIRPTDAVLTHAGIAHAHMKNAERAIALLERALEMNPRNPEANYQIGLLLEGRGDRGRGVEHLRRAARLGFPPAEQALRARGAAW